MDTKETAISPISFDFSGTDLENSGSGRKILVVTTIDLTAHCFLLNKFKAMTACGYDVSLACTMEKFRSEFEALEVHTHNIHISRSISPGSDLRSLIKLMALIREIKPDIIHTHTSKAGFIGRLAGFLCQVPVRIHTIHELPENAASNPIVKKVYNILEKAAARLATFHLTVSNPNLRQIVSEGVCPADKIAIIREGCLDLAEYGPCGSPAELKRRLGLPENAFIIGSAGRLEEAKGHSCLISAFRLLLSMLPEELASRAYLVIAGQGRLREELERQICRLNLQGRVILTGWVENLHEYVGNYDVYALDSLYEGLGIANIEAMALRRPVVCTGVGGVLDVITDGVNGLLVPPKDPQAMASALFRVCTDPQLAASLAEAGRKRVEEEFQEKPYAVKLVRLYKDLLEKHR